MCQRLQNPEKLVAKKGVLKFSGSYALSQSLQCVSHPKTTRYLRV